MRVVETPIGYRRARDTCAKDITSRHRHQRHKAAVAPTHDADAIRIHIGLSFQKLHTAELIFNFDLAELAPNGRLEGVTSKARAAIIQREDDEPLLSEQLAKVTLYCASAAHPIFANILEVWSTVGIDDDRITIAALQSRGFQESIEQCLAIARRNGSELFLQMTCDERR